MTDHDYKYGRWREKYRVTKANGDPVDPDAVYFVLRLDEDPNARAAALTYADKVAFDNPEFAYDIIRRVRQHDPSLGMDELARVADILAGYVNDARRHGFVPNTERLNLELDRLAADCDKGREGQ